MGEKCQQNKTHCYFLSTKKNLCINPIGSKQALAVPTAPLYLPHEKRYFLYLCLRITSPQNGKIPANLSRDGEI